MNRLIIISGPSGVGKSPLLKALRKFYPGLGRRLSPLTLYNSRSPRPGELDGQDYHFRSRAQIQKFRGRKGFLVMEVRGDLQALELKELNSRLKKSGVVFEGNPFVGAALLKSRSLKKFGRIGIFISPLAREEIEYLKSQGGRALLEHTLTDLQRRKLLRRTLRQKGQLGLKDLEEVERRASSAYRELGLARYFELVIPNHDGEDSDHWEAFYYPVGEARKTLLAVVEILEGKRPALGEKWRGNLIP